MNFLSDVSTSKIHQSLLALACVAIAVGCASFNRTGEPDTVPEIRPGILAGYLPIQVLPNSLAFLPAPPGPGSGGGGGGVLVGGGGGLAWGGREGGGGSGGLEWEGHPTAAVAAPIPMV